MGLFSKKKTNNELTNDQTSDNESSGSPTHHNTLHKKQPTGGMDNNATANETNDPYQTGGRTSYDQNGGMNQQIPQGGVGAVPEVHGVPSNQPGVAGGQQGYQAGAAEGNQQDFATTGAGSGSAVSSNQAGTGRGSAGASNQAGYGNTGAGASQQQAAQYDPYGGAVGGSTATGYPNEKAGMQQQQQQQQGGGFMHKKQNTSGEGFANEDLEMARAKVRAANEAEERALLLVAEARKAAKDAQEMVARLSARAEEEARLATIKQKEVMGLRQETGHLGRV